MKEANLEKQELQKEEVNVYDVNCNQGQSRMYEN